MVSRGRDALESSKASSVANKRRQVARDSLSIRSLFFFFFFLKSVPKELSAMQLLNLLLSVTSFEQAV